MPIKYIELPRVTHVKKDALLGNILDVWKNFILPRQKPSELTSKNLFGTPYMIQPACLIRYDQTDVLVQALFDGTAIVKNWQNEATTVDSTNPIYLLGSYPDRHGTRAIGGAIIYEEPETE